MLWVGVYKTFHGFWGLIGELEVELQIARLSLHLIPPIQHALGLVYHRSGHLVKFERLLSNSKVECACHIDSCAGICLIATLSSSVITVSIANQDTWEHAMMSFIYESVGRLCVFLNTAIIVNVFWKHQKMLAAIVTDIENSMHETNSGYQAVSAIVTRLVCIRGSIEEAVFHLHDMFVSATVLAALSVGIVVHMSSMQGSIVGTKFILMSMVFFFGMQCMLMCVVIRVVLSKSHIDRMTFTSTFAMRYLQRLPSNGSNDRLQRENASTVDFLALREVMRDDWVRLHFMGIPLHNGQLYKQVAPLTAVLLVALKQLSII